MKKFKVSFIGRLINAIGIAYTQEVVIECENEHQIHLKIYDTHDSILHHTVKYEELPTWHEILA